MSGEHKEHIPIAGTFSAEARPCIRLPQGLSVETLLKANWIIGEWAFDMHSDTDLAIALFNLFNNRP